MNFNVRYRSECVTEPFHGRERFLERVEEVFRTGMRESAVNPERVHALGLAVSGNVDSENGILVSGGNFGMKFGTNIPVSGLAERIGLPVYAVTTQVGAVCAEYRFGKRAGCGNLVNIGLGVGIGSGIVANHLLLISHPKRPVGYIGHILIPNNNHICTCGVWNRIPERTILRRLRRRLFREGRSCTRLRRSTGRPQKGIPMRLHSSIRPPPTTRSESPP